MFKRCLVRYLHPVDKNPARIRKITKDFSRKLDFKDIKHLAKITDIHKIEKKNCISTSVFDYQNK